MPAQYDFVVGQWVAPSLLGDSLPEVNPSGEAHPSSEGNSQELPLFLRMQAE